MPFVPDLSGKELKKLAKLAEEYSDIPESFQTSVAQAIAAQPQRAGIKGMFRRVFGATSKEK
jgi:hypothetical protein